MRFIPVRLLTSSVESAMCQVSISPSVFGMSITTITNSNKRQTGGSFHPMNPSRPIIFQPQTGLAARNRQTPLSVPQARRASRPHTRVSRHRLIAGQWLIRIPSNKYANDSTARACQNLKTFNKEEAKSPDQHTASGCTVQLWRQSI